MHKDHQHHHHDHHTENFSPAAAWRFKVAVIINLVFVGAEFFLARRCGSPGLLADAGHNLGDTAGLIISLSAFYMLKKPANRFFTYGWQKATVQASFINAVLLLAAVVLIIIECAVKFFNPVPAAGNTIMLTAGAGILINGFTVWLLAKGREHDLNIKSAYWHMLSDTLVSLGVVVAGLLITLTGWNFLDPAIGLIIAAIIIFSTWDLFKESCSLIMDGTPHCIDPVTVAAAMEQTDNVDNVHHLHIWPISTTVNALTAHIQIRDVGQLDRTRRHLKDVLDGLNIRHSALEFESAADHCAERDLFAEHCS